MTQPKFDRTAQHPGRVDAAQFTLPNFRSVRQSRPRQGQRDLVTDLVIGRAADDLAHLTAAVINLANGEPVRVWMLGGGRDSSDNDFVDIGAGLRDSFDLHARECQQFR